MSITFSLIKADDEQYITVFVPGRDPLPASSSHPNFEAIVAGCVANMRLESDAPSADDIADLFDIGATVSRKFARLSERVTVDADGIKLDGDPVHGVLQDQILDFLDAGQDFGPLVHFYEKLTTNPLGDVRDGLYGWITGQTAQGRKLTITQDGDIIGYKSVNSTTPEWRGAQDVVYVPSRRGAGIVNGIDVSSSQYIEQIPGDVVEMPRSKVLHAPSVACGDGLHIGTYEYAQSFYGNTVMAVKFSPRDIVSLPDRTSTWKLRVCRYTVLGPVTEPYDVPVFLTETKPEPVEPDAPSEGFKKGDRIADSAGDKATVLEDQGDRSGVRVKFDDPSYSQGCFQIAEFLTKIDDDEPMDLTFEDERLRVGDRVVDADGDEGTIEAGTHGYDLTVRYDDNNIAGTGTLRFNVDADGGNDFYVKTRSHGKGALTSQSAKGRNPHQDEKGRFVSGRPGSTRNASTGRFA